MAATLLVHAKEVRDDGFTVEMVVWELPEPLPPCRHRYKYRLFFGKGDRCWVRIFATISLAGGSR
jgi:hypothetical protein